MRRAGAPAVPRVSPFASVAELSVLDGSLYVLQPFTDRLIFSVRYLPTAGKWTTEPKIEQVVGSVRPGRFGGVPIGASSFPEDVFTD
jgi:hypothetical protein